MQFISLIWCPQDFDEYDKDLSADEAHALFSKSFIMGITQI